MLLLIGGALGIGAYAAPMLAGLILLPAGRLLGAKLHTVLWLAVSLLAFVLSFIPPAQIAVGSNTVWYAVLFIGCAVVTLLHIWKRNSLLSIGVGTVCYMLLVQLVF